MTGAYILLIYILGFCNYISLFFVVRLYSSIGYKSQEDRDLIYFIHYSVTSTTLVIQKAVNIYFIK